MTSVSDSVIEYACASVGYPMIEHETFKEWFNRAVYRELTKMQAINVDNCLVLKSKRALRADDLDNWNDAFQKQVKSKVVIVPENFEVVNP